MISGSEKLSNKDYDEFYQSKYDRLQKVNKLVIIISCSLEAAFFLFDCLFAKGFSWASIIPRFFIFIPMTAYLIVRKKITSYKILVPLSYIMLHTCMWTTIWASYYTSDNSFVHEQYIAMHLMFLAIGMSAPKATHIFYHAIMPVNILVSSLFLKYDNLLSLIVISLICIVAVWIIEFVFENIMLQQFIAAKKAEEMTRRDQLTNAYNRKQLTKMCIDDSSELIYKNAGIIIVDIDHFKKINETCTHEGGDRVLIELYNIIAACIRGDDICIRWGGDQFVIFIPNQGLARTKEISERIRTKVNLNESTVQNYKVSIGVTVYKGGDYFNSVNDAIKALNFAKENGRDIVIAYEDMDYRIR